MLDAAGNALEAHTFEVNHEDSDGLNIAETSSSTRHYVHCSIYKGFDGADRATMSADYGSGDSSGTWVYAAMSSRHRADRHWHEHDSQLS